MRKYGQSLLEDFTKEARRVFTIQEAMQRLNLSRPATIRIIARLKKNKEIMTLTKGLYALWHPTERTFGIDPLPIIDALMKYRRCDYYVGLLSAADHLGAAHHKPQILQVMVPKQIMLRKEKDLRIRLYVRKQFPRRGLNSLQTPSGVVPLSSPELTALDVIAYEHACGGFGNVCLVIRDLIPQLKGSPLLTLSKVYGCLSIVQRLGFMLEGFGASSSVLKPLKEWLRERKPIPIPLVRSLFRKGRIHPDWQVIENAALEKEE